MSKIYKHIGGGQRQLDVTLHVDETNAIVESIVGAHPGQRLHNRTMAEGLSRAAPAPDRGPAKFDEAALLAEANGDVVEGIDDDLAEYDQVIEDAFHDLATAIRGVMKQHDDIGEQAFNCLKMVAAAMMDLANKDRDTAKDSLAKAIKALG